MEGERDQGEGKKEDRISRAMRGGRERDKSYRERFSQAAMIVAAMYIK